MLHEGKVSLTIAWGSSKIPKMIQRRPRISAGRGLPKIAEDDRKVSENLSNPLRRDQENIFPQSGLLLMHASKSINGTIISVIFYDTSVLNIWSAHWLITVYAKL